MISDDVSSTVYNNVEDDCVALESEVGERLCNNSSTTPVLQGSTEFVDTHQPHPESLDDAVGIQAQEPIESLMSEDEYNRLLGMCVEIFFLVFVAFLE